MKCPGNADEMGINADRLRHAMQYKTEKKLKAEAPTSGNFGRRGI
jgi:hypothetical protein